MFGYGFVAMFNFTVQTGKLLVTGDFSHCALLLRRYVEKHMKKDSCDVNTRGLFRVCRYLKHLSRWATNTVTIRWPWLRVDTVGQMLYEYTVKTVKAHVCLRVCVCVHSLFRSRTVLKLELNLIFQLLLPTARDAMCAKLKCTYKHSFYPPPYTPTNKHTNLPSTSPLRLHS